MIMEPKLNASEAIQQAQQKMREKEIAGFSVASVGPPPPPSVEPIPDTRTVRVTESLKDGSTAITYSSD